MTEGAASIIESIFEQASAEESLKPVAEALQSLWREDNWNAEAIRRELDGFTEPPHSGDAK
ncbi:MAG: hypothetical protein ACXW0F_13490 [Gaiellaceae bacterium]